MNTGFLKRNLQASDPEHLAIRNFTRQKPVFCDLQCPREINRLHSKHRVHYFIGTSIGNNSKTQRVKYGMASDRAKNGHLDAAR